MLLLQILSFTKTNSVIQRFSKWVYNSLHFTHIFNFKFNVVVDNKLLSCNTGPDLKWKYKPNEHAIVTRSCFRPVLTWVQVGAKWTWANSSLVRVLALVWRGITQNVFIFCHDLQRFALCSQSRMEDKVERFKKAVEYFSAASKPRSPNMGPTAFICE